MARKVFIGSGSMATGANWANVDSTALVSNNTGSTALTTGNLDATAFAPGAVTVLGVLVRLAARAAGSPSNTMTITLRNVTGAVNVISVTVNVSDLPACTAGATSAGGWHYLKFSSSQLLLAATNYTIRATLSSTSTAVSLATNGTANNWQHMLVLNTTGAPAAGDDMHVPQLLDGATNPATPGGFTMTVDSTAATDYGSADTSNYVAALDVSKGSVITWATTAATAFILRLSGHLKVYSGGEHRMGTTGTPCPRGSSMVLEFDCSADWAFYHSTMNGGTFVGQGLSRTTGKNVSQCLLTAAVSAGATSLSSVDTDTGWLTGDEIVLSPTARVDNEADLVTLSGDAGASSMSISATTFAHPYSAAEQVQGGVMLMTRNVTIRSVSSSFMTAFVVRPTANVDCDWVAFRYLGANGGQGDYGVLLETTTGVVSFHHCSQRDCDGGGLALTGVVTSPGSVTVDSYSIYRHAVVTDFFAFTFSTAPAASGLVAVSNCWQALGIVDGAGGFALRAGNITYSGTFRLSGDDGEGVCLTGDFLGWSVGGDWHMHSCGTPLYVNATLSDVYLTGTWRGWRCVNTGLWIDSGQVQNVNFEGDVYLFGNATPGNLIVDTPSGVIGLTFGFLHLSGDSTYSSPRGFNIDNHVLDLVVHRGNFGVASGIWTAHTTCDLDYAVVFRATFVNCVFASAVETIPTVPGLSANSMLTRLHFQRKDGTAGVDYTQTAAGTIARETSTVQDSPGAKLTPFLSNVKLESHAGARGKGFIVGVLSGGTAQVSVYVRKNAAYNGNAPRLIQKRNSSAGFNADVVLDTLTVAADTWEVLTGTTGAATADGVLEFVVDCDGTAGDVFVNQWTEGSATPSGDETAWLDGLPVKARGVSVIGSGADEQASGYVG